MIDVNVDVDTTSLAAFTASVAKRLSKVPQEIGKVARRGATQLRRTDPYQNRTGDARRSTVGRREGEGAVLEMGVPYAIYLKARGFTNFDGVAEDVYEQVVELSHDAVR